ncbi:tRNA (guanosine(46)-N7)-methyltransferase TrmB [Cyanobium sp. WAJ14-Wanaka]|uniref:tRNA (guanosine(46)-N7)-methyltransferase TrmB n=1 Tax=Cyanobium sp. WAJ14-Wanaka TaxID=2823725 RepID=UPI0028F40C81|nr:tRNA (guanosine(46)-N7)-methyltransferase TrmB [Cyanobium sp. WAJ14-Wanaka]MCP9775859.1 tRNA (guanosine(46)-N7)-methyltransferase TrmB [Cyanobium sp. WAJ14-Wanaka]
MRQHVNPLSRIYQQPLALPPPRELFSDPDRPIHLDIGCARGRFLLAMAQAQPERNYLGVEIRRPLVQAAELDRVALGLTNLKYLFCNANVSLQTWLQQLGGSQLELVSIQFPDPWFKNRHHKRRVLQPELLLAIAAALDPGRELFIQSDVLAVIEPMVELIEASGCFTRPSTDELPWRHNNPLACPTERETLVLQEGLPVYRVLYQRNQQAPPRANFYVGTDNSPNSPAPLP